MTTMSDVAAVAGVSTSTVSHVVNGTRFVDPVTQQRVLDAIARTGYRHNTLARALARGGRTQSVGVALAAQANIYFGDLVSAIDSAVTALGSTMLLGETGEDPEREYRLISTLLDRRVDGIILAPGPHSERRTLPLLERSKVPTVLVDRLAGTQRLDRVGSDNSEPVARLVDHLVGHGHSRIAFISGMPGLTTSDERAAGFALGLHRNRIRFSATLIAPGSSSEVEAERAMAGLLDLADPPTAVITANNSMTIGALRVIHQRGIAIPDTIALCGFDDFAWGDLIAPPLTAIAQDWTAVGSRAAALLAARLADPDRPAVTERIATTLTIRRSCGCHAESARYRVALAG